MSSKYIWLFLDIIKGSCARVILRAKLSGVPFPVRLLLVVRSTECNHPYEGLIGVIRKYLHDQWPNNDIPSIRQPNTTKFTGFRLFRSPLRRFWRNMWASVSRRFVQQKQIHANGLVKLFFLINSHLLYLGWKEQGDRMTITILGNERVPTKRVHGYTFLILFHERRAVIKL